MRKLLLVSLILASPLVLAEPAHMEEGHGSSSGHPHNAPGMDSGHPHGMGGMGMPGGSPMRPPEGPAEEGRVLSVINGGGYSYLELDVGGKTVWVAGIPVDAKKGDKVRYVENMVMENFTSRSLNRTFERVVFASSVEKVQ